MSLPEREAAGDQVVRQVRGGREALTRQGGEPLRAEPESPEEGRQDAEAASDCIGRVEQPFLVLLHVRVVGEG